MDVTFPTDGQGKGNVRVTCLESMHKGEGIYFLRELQSLKSLTAHQGYNSSNPSVVPNGI